MFAFSERKEFVLIFVMDVQEGDVVSRSGVNELYRVGKTGKLRDGWSVVRRANQATTADRQLQVVPDGSYVSTSEPQPQQLGPVDNTLALVPGGRTTVATFEDLLGKPNSVLDLSKLDVPRFMNVPIPGIVLLPHRISASKALWSLGQSKGVPDTDLGKVSFIMQVFQVMVTHSTSPNVSDGTKRLVPSKYEGREIQVSHEDVKTTLDNALAGFGYENTLRQFARAFSPLIIQGLASGRMEPNVKICTSHGIPPNYYAYSPDCIVVDARLFNYEAALASELGKMVALGKSANARSSIHNMFENSRVAPDIFLGSRR